LASKVNLKISPDWICSVDLGFPFDTQRKKLDVCPVRKRAGKTVTTGVILDPLPLSSSAHAGEAVTASAIASAMVRPNLGNFMISSLKNSL